MSDVTVCTKPKQEHYYNSIKSCFFFAVSTEQVDGASLNSVDSIASLGPNVTLITLNSEGKLLFLIYINIYIYLFHLCSHYTRLQT